MFSADALNMEIKKINDHADIKTEYTYRYTEAEGGLTGIDFLEMYYQYYRYHVDVGGLLECISGTGWAVGPTAPILD